MKNPDRGQHVSLQRSRKENTMSKVFVVEVTTVSATGYYEVSKEYDTTIVGVYSTKAKADIAALAVEASYAGDIANNTVLEVYASVREMVLDPEPEQEESYPEPTAHHGNRSKRFSKRERRAA
jgi:hypothetical protein